MTRSKEKLYKTHKYLAESPLLQPTRLIPSTEPETYGVYWWCSKLDSLPFYVGITSCTLDAALHLPHKYPHGAYAVQHLYRHIIGDDFLCVIAANDITKPAAFMLQHYLYKTFTSLEDNTNQDACFTQKEPRLPSWAPSYNIIRPLPTPPPSSPQEVQIRRARKAELQAKLLKRLENQKYQQELKERKAKKRARKNS
jgi:hypothetical protein